jgi:predicted CoA-binding protein
MRPTALDDARAFLEAKRIAIVGASRDEKDFSRYVIRELARRGYDVVPVNPAAAEVDGRRCFAHVQEVWPPPEAVLLLTPSGRTEDALRECVASGVRRVWLHRGAGAGASTPAALAFCKAHGLSVVHDLCPFMALPGAAFPHRVHAFVRRTLG